ncbi:MAG: hypothetical protein K2N34_05050 [Lachnospiraceae bacterium]|nr:hypothetical protein [Lachnospiraceae bacterium]
MDKLKLHILVRIRLSHLFHFAVLLTAVPSSFTIRCTVLFSMEMPLSDNAFEIFRRLHDVHLPPSGEL